MRDAHILPYFSLRSWCLLLVVDCPPCRVRGPPVHCARRLLAPAPACVSLDARCAMQAGGCQACRAAPLAAGPPLCAAPYACLLPPRAAPATLRASAAHTVATPPVTTGGGAARVEPRAPAWGQHGRGSLMTRQPSRRALHIVRTLRCLRRGHLKSDALYPVAAVASHRRAHNKAQQYTWAREYKRTQGVTNDQTKLGVHKRRPH